MRISPINSATQNDKKLSFTAIKADAETLGKINQVAKKFNRDFFTLSDIAADLRNDPKAKSLALGQYLSDKDRAHFSTLKDIFMSTVEVVNLHMGFYSKDIPLVKLLKDVEKQANSNIVTPEIAEKFLAENLESLNKVEGNLNKLLGTDASNLNNKINP